MKERKDWNKATVERWWKVKKLVFGSRPFRTLEANADGDGDYGSESVFKFFLLVLLMYSYRKSDMIFMVLITYLFIEMS